MQHSPPTPTLTEDLLALIGALRDRHDEDPFGNPVLSAALAISRRIDRGELPNDVLTDLVATLRDAAFADRAVRLAAYVGGLDGAEAAMTAVARRIARPDPADSPVPFSAFREAVERPRFAAVFTGHPTFALPTPVAAALAGLSGGTPAAIAVSHRPGPVTLEEEFSRAQAAITLGRDAVDTLVRAILAAARETWPERSADLVPAPVMLSTWVGYDTDGRTDIGWWDTLRLRLRMKAAQLSRLLDQAPAISDRLTTALEAVQAQVAACPRSGETPTPDAVAGFAAALVGRRTEAVTDPAELDAALRAVADTDPPGVAVARAGLRAHGLSLAQTHVRLNAAQIHNAIRQRLGLSDPPEDPSHRRALLHAINGALDTVTPVPVDFGALLVESASAVRLFMTVAQIVKHIDTATPVRFLIAETETGYTLLAALWLARLLGIADRIEISPLFETAAALEQGGRVVEEALRSPHWRAYLSATGRMAVQFGYSDSGRYVGPLPATYLVERLRLKFAEALARHGLTDVELVLFDTHGESVGRGGHPGSLAARLDYLSPPHTRRILAAEKIACRTETAFQGGDGFLLFGTPALALATVARIAEHALCPAAEGADPIYEEADFSADFFATVRSGVQELVEDPGYAALLGAFGPALLDPSGSRPAARQMDGMGGPAVIRHPRELRAIPNNAVLQQLGWMANTLHGVGAAASRQPEAFAEFSASSPRFANALALPAHALAHSDIDVLRAVVVSLDPGMWLDRAAHARLPGRRGALVAIARALERLAMAAPVAATFRRVQADHVALRAAWPGAPQMGPRLLLLHALRLALIHRIWLLAVAVPDFSPRHGVTRQAIEQRLLRLDVPGALAVLREIFPAARDPAVDRDYGEVAAPREAAAYAREHAEIFSPMEILFGLVRELGVAVTHEVGAFG